MLTCGFQGPNRTIFSRHFEQWHFSIIMTRSFQLPLSNQVRLGSEKQLSNSFSNCIAIRVQWWLEEELAVLFNTPLLFQLRHHRGIIGYSVPTSYKNLSRLPAFDFDPLISSDYFFNSQQLKRQTSF